MLMKFAKVVEFGQKFKKNYVKGFRKFLLLTL